MSTAAPLRVPMALASEEVKWGILQQLRRDRVPEDAVVEIQKGLGRTCLLNRQCYSKFSVKWRISKGNWSIDGTLDDFGRESILHLGGILPNVELEMDGSIDPMPPDAFRRQTEQPIPQQRAVKAKAEDGVGMSLARKSPGKRKMQ
jgi:hypothetical protein